MISATGSEVKAAIHKAAVWGTPVAVGANDGILIQPSSIKKTMGTLVDDSLGLYFAKEASDAEIKVEGDISSYLRYDGLDLLIALAMGATGGLPTEQGVTSAYAQVFSLADSLDGLFATFCINNGINIDEYSTLKVTGMNIKGQVGKPLTVQFPCIAIDRVTGSATNTLVTFANVTIFEPKNRVLFGQGVFRLNVASGAALGSGDIVYPASFDLTLKRKMAGVYGAGNSSNVVDEPSNNGKPEVTLKLEFDRYKATTYFDDWSADTLMKMDMTFTGALIATPYNRSFKLSFPNMKISNVDLPISAGILKQPVEFVCLACDAAPTGMTATKPFEIDVINRQSANVLA